jgi:hypothetical protein
MVYKDKDKQREANRRAQAKFKAKKVLVGQGITDEVLPEYPRVSDQDFTRRLATLPPGSPTVRVSKPGDADYEPQCETTKAFINGKSKCSFIDMIEPKRGKDIKVFADLPWDVQQTIDIMSVVEGKMNQTIKANRTAIAIHYQHTFPERY